MKITGDLNDEYLIMSMISRHVAFSFYFVLTVDDILKAKVTCLLTPNTPMSKQLNY